ncbi:MAG: dienelactone hydrolase family protein [Chloracidobacterium sp.]|nr:dienelactone hydrolase family protein [Chloracidobacterium sp.]
MKKTLLLPVLFVTLASARLPMPPRAFTSTSHKNDVTRQENNFPTPSLVSFPSGNLTLRGFLFKPEGDGPFPAIIWNHSYEKFPGQQPLLARFYIKQGFVFFLPHRHGQGQSPGDYFSDTYKKYLDSVKNPPQVQKRFVELQEEYNQDVVAAVEWLKGQSFVDQQRIVMSGCFYGGIQALLVAEKDLGVRAFALFSIGPLFKSNVVRDRLLKAIQAARAPIFLIQPQNDFDLAPSEALGPAIMQKGAPNQAKIYPPYGNYYRDGGYFFATRDDGISIWGEDVMKFFRAAIQ